MAAWSADPLLRMGFVALAGMVAFAFPQFHGDGLSLRTAYLAEIYILLALGLNVVVGFAGLLDLGYAAFFAIGAYTGAILGSPQLGQYFSHVVINNPLLYIGPAGFHINFFLLIPVAAIIAALFGITFGAPTLRLRGDYLAIVTLGFGEIVPNVIKNLGLGNSIVPGRSIPCPTGSLSSTCGSKVPGLPLDSSGNLENLTNGVNSITGIHSPFTINLGPLDLNFSGLDQRPWYYLGFAVICLSVFLVYRLRGSRLGRSWIAMREDEIAAAHAGIHITGTRLTAFAIGASFSGFGGLLWGAQLGSVSYDLFLFSVSVTILVMVILGGIGSIPGVIMGGVVIAYLSQTWLDDLSLWINSQGAHLHRDTWPVGGHVNISSTVIAAIVAAILIAGVAYGLWRGAPRAQGSGERRDVRSTRMRLATLYRSPRGRWFGAVALLCILLGVWNARVHLGSLASWLGGLPLFLRPADDFRHHSGEYHASPPAGAVALEQAGPRAASRDGPRGRGRNEELWTVATGEI